MRAVRRNRRGCLLLLTSWNWRSIGSAERSLWSLCGEGRALNIVDASAQSGLPEETAEPSTWGGGDLHIPTPFERSVGNLAFPPASQHPAPWDGSRRHFFAVFTVLCVNMLLPSLGPVVTNIVRHQWLALHYLCHYAYLHRLCEVNGLGQVHTMMEVGLWPQFYLLEVGWTST